MDGSALLAGGSNRNHIAWSSHLTAATEGRMSISREEAHSGIRVSWKLRTMETLPEVRARYLHESGITDWEGTGGLQLAESSALQRSFKSSSDPMLPSREGRDRTQRADVYSFGDGKSISFNDFTAARNY